jgi:peroxygenase
MAFFDPDQDGVVWPWDTYTAFRKLDFDILLSLFAVLMINVTFSYATLDSWIPNLLFPIRYKARGYKLKHGSDSETYDTEGRFVPEKVRGQIASCSRFKS